MKILSIYGLREAVSLSLMVIGLIQPLLAASPDSLLTLSPAQQLRAIGRSYDKLLKKDTNAADQFRHELTAFYAKKGRPKDRLIFEVAILGMDRASLRYNDRFLGRAHGLLQKAEALADTSLMARIHLLLGLYHFNIRQNYYLAFTHYLKTFEGIKALTEEQFPERDYTIYLIARAYYEFFDYENTIRIAQALTTSSKAQIKNTHIFTTCMLGMACVKLKRYGAARRYFDWGLTHLPVKNLNNEAWVGILKGNIGLLLAEQQQNTLAMPFLQEGIRLTTRHEVWDSAAQFGSRLAILYLAQNQLTRAGELAHQAHRAALRKNMAKFSQETYQVLATYYRQNDQPALALRYADSAALAHQAWNKEIDVTLKHKAEMVVESERHHWQQNLLEKEKERQILLRNALLVLIALALVVSYLLYSRQLLSYRHRQALLLAEKQRAEAEWQKALGQLDQFTRNIQEKSQLIEHFTQQLRQMEPQPTVANPHYQLLEQLHQSVLLTDQGWEKFRLLFEQVHQGYLVRLKEKLPGLSPAETRFMTLCKLHYTNKEMAAMLGVSTQAIRQLRSRLRRKLNLPEGIDIEELAAQV